MFDIPFIMIVLGSLGLFLTFLHALTLKFGIFGFILGVSASLILFGMLLATADDDYIY